MPAQALHPLNSPQSPSGPQNLPGRRADASQGRLGLAPACADPEMPLSPAGQAPSAPCWLCRWDGRGGWREPGKPVPGTHPHSSPAGAASPGHQPAAGWAAGPSSPGRPPCSQLCRSGTTEGRGHTTPLDRRPSCPSGGPPPPCRAKATRVSVEGLRPALTTAALVEQTQRPRGPGWARTAP